MSGHGTVDPNPYARWQLPQKEDWDRPRLETKHEIFDARFLPASSQGTRPDVGGRLARAYRLCTHGMLLIPVDFRHGRGADQGASLGWRS